MKYILILYIYLHAKQYVPFIIYKKETNNRQNEFKLTQCINFAEESFQIVYFAKLLAHFIQI